jgi:hypothetical protein
VTRRPCASALLCLVALACDGGPHGVNDAVHYEVWFSSPHAADQAVVVTFDDQLEVFEPAPDVRYFRDPGTGSSTLLLIADWPLPAGETLLGDARLRTRSRTSLPTARVMEVARSDYQLRNSVAAYRVRLVPLDR